MPSNSFWGKKFGAGVPTPTPRPPQQVPAHLLPQGMAGRQQAGVQHYVGQLPAFQAPPAEEEPYGGWQPNTLNPKTMDEVLPIWHWKGNPRGGAAETQLCPDCGSANYFSRAQGAQFNSNTGQSVLPAPECFNCGYPRQQGSLGTATVTGAAQAARQGATPPMPTGSLAALGPST